MHTHTHPVNCCLISWALSLFLLILIPDIFVFLPSYFVLFMSLKPSIFLFSLFSFTVVLIIFCFPLFSFLVKKPHTLKMVMLKILTWILNIFTILPNNKKGRTFNSDYSPPNLHVYRD